MRKIVVSVLLLLSINAFSQKWELCYWESNFWMHYIQYVDDSVGSFVSFYSNENKKLEGSFEYEIPSGTWIHYADNGKKVVETHYTGTYTRWDLNGKLAEKGQYVNGKKVGVWQQFALENDSVYLAVEYNTELKMIKEFDKAGVQKNEYEIELQEYNRNNIYPGSFFVEVVYGYQAVNIEPFYKYLNHNKKDTFVNDYIGIGILNNPRNKFCYSAYFNYYLPNTNNVNDTISFKTSGYNVYANIGNDFIKSPRFDVIWNFGAGFAHNSVEPQVSISPNYYDTLFDFSTTKQITKNTLLLNTSLEGKINYIIKQQGARSTGVSLGGRVGYFFHVSDGIFKPDDFFLHEPPAFYFDGFYLSVVGAWFF